ncbi:hypothetical protein Goarm_020000, partial [Gossypium armourianum]|nr:hypothetical protein [Gossypium armourianum]
MTLKPRLGHDIIPTCEKISSIRRDVNSLCPRCSMEKDTLIHALKDCPKARAVLAYGGLNKKLLDGSYGRRNKRVFQEVEEDAKVIWDRAASLSRDFCIFNLMEKHMTPKPVVEKGWQKPDPGVIKINFDATVHKKKACYSLVARDTDGFVHSRCVGCVKKDLSVEWA